MDKFKEWFELGSVLKHKMKDPMGDR